MKILSEIIIRLVVSIALIVILITTVPSIMTKIMSQIIPGKISVEQSVKQGAEQQKEQYSIGETVARESQNFAKALLNPLEENAKKMNEKTKERIRENEPRRIIGYNEKRIPGRSWEECIKEYGRGRKELNENVVRCQNGYTEKTPIYNKGILW